MKVILNSDIELEYLEMRDVYCNVLIEMAEKDDRLVMLDADLMNSIKTTPFQKKFPQRTFNCGIQEANMVGVAAGLSAVNKIPFAHTFAPFATRRVMDQVFVSCAYNKANVKLIGSDPGITAAFNGGTHMPFEDMAVMVSIPTITAVEPSDSVMLANLLTKIKDSFGIYYIRLLRKQAWGIYKQGSDFDIGKAVLLREGKDVTIISSGIMVKEALTAADMLDKEGISANVVDMFTWKPIDEKLIVECAKISGAIVTAENHNIICGLGAQVARVICNNKPVPIEYVGINDEFGEVGPQDYLRLRYSLTAEEIVKKAKIAIAKKRDYQ